VILPPLVIPAKTLGLIKKIIFSRFPYQETYVRNKKKGFASFRRETFDRKKFGGQTFDLKTFGRLNI
jgi:hypothetical protein